MSAVQGSRLARAADQGFTSLLKEPVARTNARETALEDAQLATLLTISSLGSRKATVLLHVQKDSDSEVRNVRKFNNLG